jgi:ankyrin repeat protein
MGHVDVTQLLLKHGADTEAQDEDKCTPVTSGVEVRVCGSCSRPSHIRRG